MSRIAILLLAGGLALGSANASRAAAGPAGHTHAAAEVGAPGNPASVSRTIRLEAYDTSFSTSQIKVRAGETIRFIIVNESSIPHEFSIASHQEQIAHRAMMRDMPDMTHTEPNTVTLQPGETKQLIWHFGRGTNIEFACNIPGHAEQGMTGAFHVVNR